MSCRWQSFGSGRSLDRWLHSIAKHNLRDAIKELERKKRPSPAMRVAVGANSDSCVVLIELLHAQEDQKILVFRRGPLVMVFNFHTAGSYPDYRIGVPDPADYRLVLTTDDAAFGGFGRVAPGQTYPQQDVPAHGRAQSTQLYLPARSAQVLHPE